MLPHPLNRNWRRITIPLHVLIPYSNIPGANSIRTEGPAKASILLDALSVIIERATGVPCRFSSGARSYVRTYDSNRTTWGSITALEDRGKEGEAA